jgi:pSer/pThr/pTyr-binding forkhead associated (FHA) protein
MELTALMLAWPGSATEGMAVIDLVVLSGSRAGACFGIPDVPVVIGRSLEANVRIDDPWISNMHALIEPRAGELWVVDLGSRNGTFIDDQPITEGRLVPGTALAFGRTRLELRERTAASALDAEPMKTPMRMDPVSVTMPHQLRLSRPLGAAGPGPKAPGPAGGARGHHRRGPRPAPKGYK